MDVGLKAIRIKSFCYSQISRPATTLYFMWCFCWGGLFVHLSGARVLKGACLLRTCGAFYHPFLFPTCVEEHHQVLQIEPGDQLNPPAERGAGRQGEG